MKKLDNKVALITGAASGIGEAIARLFVAEGVAVMLVDRDEERLSALASEIDNAKVVAFIADVSSQEDLESAVTNCLDKFKGIDIAVLNAGIPGTNAPIEDYPVDVFEQVLDINLKGVWLGMRAVIPTMKAQQSGSIILTSSIQGLSALAGTTGYTTSKHAVVGMMKGAALELAEYGVRVNAIHPGYVETPMMAAIHEEVVPDAPEQFQAAIASTVPMKRYAKADEIARLALFLASDDSTYSTGSSFLADGGILAALPS